MNPKLVALLVVALCLLASSTSADENRDARFDLVLAGGRVMDPESGLDAVRNVGIRAGRIAAVTEGALSGNEVVDVSGLVVSPGFIDLHVHGQDPKSWGFMARDGVTTALDLELGVYRLKPFFARREGRAVIHYGVAVGHMPARMKLKHGFDVGHALTDPLFESRLRRWVMGLLRRFYRPTGWSHEPADREEIRQLLEFLSDGLDQGGIGIGIGIQYTPGATDEELEAVFRLAAERGVPCFVHMAGGESPEDSRPIEAVLKYVDATGAALHILHLTSTSVRAAPRYLERIEAARAAGLDVTTEAYPYTAYSTAIESAAFDEGWQVRDGIDYGDLQWVATGERLTRESFEKYRRQGGLVIGHAMPQEIVDAAIVHPLVMIASDGVPMVTGGEHPRGAGTHALILGRYVRERRLLGLMDAIRKMSLMPARRLEAFVPAMRAKGRIRPGADADIAIFDPATVIDRATFQKSHQYSDGIPHVLVGGAFVVRDGELVPDVFPGRGIRAELPGT